VYLTITSVVAWAAIAEPSEKATATTRLVAKRWKNFRFMVITFALWREIGIFGAIRPLFDLRDSDEVNDLTHAAAILRDSKQ
jgi:hypothetical protein